MDELASHEALQAVLVADSFSSTFWPITATLPKALIPLANIPLIDYAVEFLARNKVKELIIFCTVFPQVVEQYMAKVRVKGCKVKCYHDDGCKSMGDVLRWLDQSDLIKSDFILMTSDVVSNADLSECLSQHKARRKTNGDFILTRIFKSQPSVCRLRTRADQIAVALKENEIVQFEDLRESTEMLLKGDFSKSTSFNIHLDLVDTGVCVCTPELLSRFTDNFDFHTMDQVVKELLTNEIYTDKVAAYIVASHFYLSRVQDPRTYDAIAKDVLSRWTHPIVLNNNLLPYTAATTYRCQHSDLYQEDGVQLSYTALVTPPSAIGSKTRVDDSAQVIRSVIGRDCHIMEGARVEGVYLWDGVTIGKGAKVTKSIICTGCVIGANCVVPAGSILSMGVVLPNNTVLVENTRLALPPCNDGSGEKVGNGFVHWPIGDDEKRSRLIAEQCMGGALGIWDEDPDWSSDTDSSSDGSSIRDYIVQPDEGQLSAAFVDEIKGLVKDAMNEDEEPDALFHSINNFRFSQERSVKECIAGIVKGLFAVAPANVKTIISHWASLLKRFQTDMEDQLHMIREIETAIVPINCKRKFHVILSELYILEIVEDKAIFRWAEENRDEELRTLVTLTQTSQLVEFLQAESDDEEEDDD